MNSEVGCDLLLYEGGGGEWIQLPIKTPKPADNLYP